MKIRILLSAIALAASTVAAFAQTTVPISRLPQAFTINPTDQIPIVQSGVTKRIAASSLMLSLLSPPTASVLGGVHAQTAPTGRFVTGVGTDGNLIFSSGVVGVENGGTGDTGSAWTAYTPTVTCDVGGPPTIAGPIAAYKQLGKTVFYRIAIAFSAKNGCSGAVNVTIPTAPAVTSEYVGGFDTNSALAVAGFIGYNTSTFRFVYYNGSGAVWTDSDSFVLTGLYETQ